MKEEAQFFFQLAAGAFSIASATAFLTWFIAKQFTQMRKFVYAEMAKRDRAIRRLEFWAVRTDRGYQPGIDPDELIAADQLYAGLNGGS